MKNEEAKLILKHLKSFAELHHKNTDEEGWIALKRGCSVRVAEVKIHAARRWQLNEATPDLLTACKMALRRLENLLSEETGPCEATEAVRAAISKAEKGA